MALFKRNLWTLFYFLLFAGLVLLGVILYYRWLSIIDEVESYHRSRAELMAESVSSVLRNQEFVLDVIGRELLRQDSDVPEGQAPPILDTILSLNHSLADIGLATPDGDFMTAGSWQGGSPDARNLLNNALVADSFTQALDGNAMVLGRTYFSQRLDSWVIPLMKALRTDGG